MRFSTRESVGPLNRLRPSEREAVIAYDHVAQDVPLCPTSLENPLPILPEEAEDGLTPAQRIAVAAIVAGQTSAMAARATGVSRRTLSRWRQQAAFKQAIDQLSVEALDASVTRVRNLMLRATRVMSEALMGHASMQAAYRVLNSARLWKVLESAKPAMEDAAEPMPQDDQPLKGEA